MDPIESFPIDLETYNQDKQGAHLLTAEDKLHAIFSMLREPRYSKRTLKHLLKRLEYHLRCARSEHFLKTGEQATIKQENET